MTSLDAARRVATGPCPTFWDVELVGTVGRFGPDQGSVLKCAHCRQKLHEHAPDCPWLSMPRIVAALEAAERMVDEVGEPVVSPEEFGVTEVPDRLYRPLVAAMKEST